MAKQSDPALKKRVRQWQAAAGTLQAVLVWFLKKVVFKEEKKKKSEAGASGRREVKEQKGLPAVDRPKRFVYGEKK